ncbi:MAG TPA: PIN domain-containing protein [Thermoguttaceae bacterium]|nr:PIN domain-containing protein [Thermoguttaceae bacterium]
MPGQIVLYDACVLYPAPLRDLLMHLALTDLFHARWTNEIHEEWIGKVLLNRPDLNRRQLERTRRLMNEYARDCLVEGYEELIPRLQLPDLHDRHVLAAAIHSEATVIVTFNLKDFPPAQLEPFDIEARHPDDYIVEQFDLEPRLACAAARRHRTSLKNPPKSVAEYLDTLSRQQLPKTVSRLSSQADQI